MPDRISRQAGMLFFLMIIFLAAAFCLTATKKFAADRKKRISAARAAARLDPALFDGKRAFGILGEFLETGPRPSGSEGAEKAAVFIARRLAKLGLKGEIDTFKADTPAGETTFRNVTATKTGGGSGIIVLLSHYDTKHLPGINFIGANDSGSSTATLLELANVINAGNYRGPDVMLAFVDGEECIKEYSEKDGLHGSRRLAERLARTGETDNVLAVIVVDMVGDRNLTVTIPGNSTTHLTAIAFAAAEAEQVRAKFSLTGPIIDDHVPFLEMGFPAIDIIDFRYGESPESNEYWHTAGDTIDKISPESLATTGRVLIRMINRLADNSRAAVSGSQ